MRKQLERFKWWELRELVKFHRLSYCVEKLCKGVLIDKIMEDVMDY